ncbi:hypothetical protein G1H11_16055 [Phytoactinopolyspora alkaliphila]|uniref:Uncharacterized protein n=1 Tax=Phytoactinopolyspora alkaliphila TaxID=1783498 RepID=A0A6N9YPB9_9ACTN|nr:hypothetical protein [Phytoactinopolyspora alkaliphila]NED96822.1 hypothetical protein [Phytoactinopolyspora alkaliphila]
MFDPGAHVFVDEGKSKGYVLAATSTQPTSLAAARAAMRRLLLPGQDRLHFAKESDPRRRSILSAMAELDVSVILYVSPAKSHKVGRERCLQALLDDVLKH